MTIIRLVLLCIITAFATTASAQQQFVMPRLEPMAIEEHAAAIRRNALRVIGPAATPGKWRSRYRAAFVANVACQAGDLVVTAALINETRGERNPFLATREGNLSWPKAILFKGGFIAGGVLVRRAFGNKAGAIFHFAGAATSCGAIAYNLNLK